MGKIYDALKKAKKEASPSVEAGDASVAQFYEKAPQKDTAVDLLQPLQLNERVDRNLVSYLNPQSLVS